MLFPFTGQALDDDYQKELENENIQRLPYYRRICIKYRHLIGMAIPALFFQFFWLVYFIKFEQWNLFKVNDNYRITIMAIFGSLIAGKFCGF